MEKIKPFTHFFLLIANLALVFYLIGSFSSQDEKKEEQKDRQAQALQQENSELKAENKLLASKNDYLKSLPTDFKQKNGYFIWPEYDKIANQMVAESDGKFKKTWALYLVREANRYQIDPYLVYELLRVETGGEFNPNLVGPNTKYGHAYGLSQFMKNTAPWIADMAGLPYEDKLLFDPYYSMQLSLTYLDFLYNQYNNWDEALTAYNRGMGGLEQFEEEHGHAKSLYARRIQTNAQAHQTLAIAQ